jgi:hypothetical protein
MNRTTHILVLLLTSSCILNAQHKTEYKSTSPLQHVSDTEIFLPDSIYIKTVQIDGSIITGEIPEHTDTLATKIEQFSTFDNTFCTASAAPTVQKRTIEKNKYEVAEQMQPVPQAHVVQHTNPNQPMIIVVGLVTALYLAKYMLTGSVF